VAVCKKAYVHPRVLELAAQHLVDEAAAAPKPRTGLSRAEVDLLHFLKRLD